HRRRRHPRSSRAQRASSGAARRVATPLAAGRGRRGHGLRGGRKRPAGREDAGQSEKRGATKHAAARGAQGMTTLASRSDTPFATRRVTLRCASSRKKEVNLGG